MKKYYKSSITAELFVTLIINNNNNNTVMEYSEFLEALGALALYTHPDPYQVRPAPRALESTGSLCRQGIYVEYSMGFSRKCRALNGLLVGRQSTTVDC
eukprot:7866229-Pyramimonas_sp.AAC.1